MIEAGLVLILAHAVVDQGMGQLVGVLRARQHRRKVGRQRLQRGIGQRPDRPKQMIATHPLLKINV
jgi:hypothetical protein